MNQLETQSVSIDGHRIKHIREEKRLTQLYVAKVVGVTTDTVSRWENNRYPTIRRDNALNLAEALEVALEEILKHEEAPVAEVSEKIPSKPWVAILVVGFMLVVGAWLLYQMVGRTASVLQAERLQPHFAAPGSRILVRVQLSLDKSLKGVIVKEQFPPGWKFIDSVPPVSSVGNQASTARWMLRNPASHTTIAYLLEVDVAASPSSDQRIIGEVIANPDGQQSSVPVKSAEDMQIAPLHWADADGNQIIDDMEILEISDLFENTEFFRDEWERIESLWDAGGYRWSKETGQFEPLEIE